MCQLIVAAMPLAWQVGWEPRSRKTWSDRLPQTPFKVRRQLNHPSVSTIYSSLMAGKGNLPTAISLSIYFTTNVTWTVWHWWGKMWDRIFLGSSAILSPVAGLFLGVIQVDILIRKHVPLEVCSLTRGKHRRQASSERGGHIPDLLPRSSHRSFLLPFPDYESNASFLQKCGKTKDHLFLTRLGNNSVTVYFVSF